MATSYIIKADKHFENRRLVGYDYLWEVRDNEKADNYITLNFATDRTMPDKPPLNMIKMDIQGAPGSGWVVTLDGNTKEHVRVQVWIKNEGPVNKDFQIVGTIRWA